MRLTVHRFIENHRCNEDEEYCPHVIWSVLECCVKDALEVAQAEEILWFFMFTAEVSIHINLTLESGISGMRLRASCLFQKHSYIGHVNYVQAQD